MASRPKDRAAVSGGQLQRTTELLPLSAPQRIRVLGASGSGKTTTARAIADRLDYPRLEIDSVFWLPDWQERDRAETLRIVTEFAEQSHWVIDGNYRSLVGDALDDRTDLTVWIDLPRWRTCVAVARRTVRRSRTREDLWGTGNTESIKNLFKVRPLDNLVIWSWKQAPRYRKAWAPLASESPERWVRLRSRKQVSDFLKRLGGT